MLGAAGSYLRIADVQDHESLLNFADETLLGGEKSAFCKRNTGFGTLQAVSRDSDADLEDDYLV